MPDQSRATAQRIAGIPARYCISNNDLIVHIETRPLRLCTGKTTFESFAREAPEVGNRRRLVAICAVANDMWLLPNSPPSVLGCIDNAYSSGSKDHVFRQRRS